MGSKKAESNQLTYGKLIDELAELGYDKRTITWKDGTKKWEFDHREKKEATIILATRPLDQPVHRWNLFTVRTILQANDIVSENGSQKTLLS